jgi:hypothetical protein
METLEKNFDVLQSDKFGNEISAGENMLEWLAKWLENIEKENN